VRFRAGGRVPGGGTLSRVLDDLIGDQHGIVTREQALRCGLSDAGIAARVAAGRWRRVFGRVYATFSGPLPRRAHLWAVVLRCGRDAMLSHETAAEVCGLSDAPSEVVHVTLPWERRIARLSGVCLHRTGRARACRGAPPHTCVEDTVVDLTQSAPSLDAAAGWIARACGRRLTTADRLGRAFAARPKLRWREQLTAAVADVALGCHSLLELRYLRDVERAHGLPPGLRQHRVGTGYQDVRYRDGVVVELDGRLGHTGDGAFRDLRRDNASVCAGEVVLRYGWADVTERPCEVAAQVAAVLRRAGWTGSPWRCTRCLS